MTQEFKQALLTRFHSSGGGALGCFPITGRQSLDAERRAIRPQLQGYRAREAERDGGWGEKKKKKKKGRLSKQERISAPGPGSKQLILGSIVSLPPAVS